MARVVIYAYCDSTINFESTLLGLDGKFSVGVNKYRFSYGEN